MRLKYKKIQKLHFSCYAQNFGAKVVHIFGNNKKKWFAF